MPVQRAYLGLDLASADAPAGKGTVGIPTQEYNFTLPRTYPDNVLATPKLSLWGTGGSGGDTTYAYPIGG